MSEDHWLSGALGDLVSGEHPSADLRDQVVARATGTRRRRRIVGGLTLGTAPVIAAVLVWTSPGSTSHSSLTSANPPAFLVTSTVAPTAVAPSHSLTPGVLIAPTAAATSQPSQPPAAAPTSGAPLKVSIQGPTTPVLVNEVAHFVVTWSVGLGVEMATLIDPGDHQGIGSYKAANCANNPTWGQQASGGSDNEVHTYTAAGVYTYRIQITTGGCSVPTQSQWASWTVSVRPNPSPTPTATAAPSPTPMPTPTP